MYAPDSEGISWKCYKSNCPCCRRPLEITISSVKEEPWTSYARGSRYAFVTALWGANAGYAFGAMVLGWRLRELSPGIERVMLHTDDVPRNYLDFFAKDDLWKLCIVDYIDGVSKVFTGAKGISLMACSQSLPRHHFGEIYIGLSAIIHNSPITLHLSPIIHCPSPLAKVHPNLVWVGFGYGFFHHPL